jgi:peptidoglycan/LPS O-acetylase OafA/YrhL
MDFFRMAAATLVAGSHIRDILLTDYAGQTLYLPFYAATGLGHSGVIVFFVLSGFWISRSVLKRIDRPGFWPAYLIDRLSRLEIVLLPALILGGLADALGIFVLQLPVYSGAGGSHSLSYDAAQRLSFAHFAGNLAFLQTIALDSWGSNGPLWSLANEFWYYIWFPALILLVRKRRLSWGLLGLVVGLISPAILVGFASWLAGFGLLLLVGRLPLADQESNVARLIRFAVATAVFLAVLAISGLWKRSELDVPLAVTFGWFLFELARARLPFPVMLLPLARFGSGSSFSLYVIHFPLIALIGGWFARDGRMAPAPQSIALVFGLMLFCITVAWLFSRVTEAHTAVLRSWLKARSIAPIETKGG